MDMLSLLRFLDEIEHPAPDFDAPNVTKDPSDWAAMYREHWNREAPRRAAERARQLAEGRGPESASDAVLTALRAATDRARKAADARDALIAIAVHGMNLPIRPVADAAQMHPRTAEKRADAPLHMDLLLRFKVQEVEDLRARAAAAAEQQPDQDNPDADAADTATEGTTPPQGGAMTGAVASPQRLSAKALAGRGATGRRVLSKDGHTK